MPTDQIAEPHRVARKVPTFSWSAASQWSSQPIPIAILLFGLTIFGIGDWLLIASELGNSPWSVLAGGLDRHLGFGIGTVTIIVSMVVLLSWIPLRQRPGLGTIANAVVVGGVVEIMERTMPPVENVAARVVMMFAGLAIVGIGGALYLSSRLGPGPRDGLMTGIGTRADRPIAHVRLAIEVSVLIVGIILGGRVGIGTFVFAVGIGHVLAFFVALLHRLDSRRQTSVRDPS